MSRWTRSSASLWTFVALWLATTAALQWSVVRFRVLILLTLTVAAAALAVTLWRGRAPELQPMRDRVPLTVLWLGSAVILVTVPLFTYLRGGARTAAILIVCLVAAGAVALLVGPWRDHRGLPVALALWAGAGHVALACVAIIGDRAPKIDVWVMLQQSSDALLRGENFYDVTWVGSPGVQDLYTYLPWMTPLVAPGRWLAGDVRWTLVLWTMVLFVGLWLLARGRSGRGPLAAASVMVTLVVIPGAITQVDQAWTEPVLAALVIAWAALVQRGRANWAILPLALACASKQHLALLMPLLALWHLFGWRRVLLTGLGAAGLISPWFVTSPAAFINDTITSLVHFHPIRFANTWFLFFLNEFGITLPFWITGVVVLGTVAIAGYAIHRRQPPLDEMLRWLALVLLAANLVNKQAFYNQFWLSLALVAASLVLGPASTSEHPEVTPRRDAAAEPSRTPGSRRESSRRP
ncbi:MAG TPA: hypothetical protein PK868_04330 [Phycicoccus sp.]|nr:hypothetical protein [Phycicoccus sp.]HQK32376.1 hypothetical protein [Phycicoccus sp.]